MRNNFAKQKADTIINCIGFKDFGFSITLPKFFMALPQYQ